MNLSLSGTNLVFCLSLLFAVWSPHLTVTSGKLSPSAPLTTMVSASTEDRDQPLPTPMQIESPAPSPSPLPIATPSSSVQQGLGSLETKIDELIDKVDSSRSAAIVDVIHKIVMIVAIGISGVWGYWLFVQNRQRYPHASIRHHITHMAVSDEKVLLHVTETIRNEGKILLSLEFIQTRIQRMLPPPDDLLEALAEGEPVLAEGSTQYLWPLIGLHECKWTKDQCEVEPNESTDIHHDFIIGGEVEVVAVYTYVKNMVKRHREIGWDFKTVYDLRDSQGAPRQDERMEE